MLKPSVKVSSKTAWIIDFFLAMIWEDKIKIEVVIGV